MGCAVGLLTRAKPCPRQDDGKDCRNNRFEPLVRRRPKGPGNFRGANRHAEPRAGFAPVLAARQPRFCGGTQRGCPKISTYALQNSIRRPHPPDRARVLAQPAALLCIEAVPIELHALCNTGDSRQVNFELRGRSRWSGRLGFRGRVRCRRRSHWSGRVRCRGRSHWSGRGRGKHKCHGCARWAARGPSRR